MAITAKTMFLVDSLINDKLTVYIKNKIKNSIPTFKVKMNRGQIDDDSFYYIQVGRNRFLYSDQTEREIDFARLANIYSLLQKESASMFDKESSGKLLN